MTGKAKKLDGRFKRALIVMGALLLALGGFFGGYWYRSEYPASTNYSSIPFISRSASQPSQTVAEVAARLEEVQSTLDQEAYNQTDVDTATSILAQALLKAAGDTYGRYYTAGQYQDYLEKNTDEYAGIGIVLSEYEGTAYVARVHSGSPAETAGIQEGDFITAIDGETRTSWTLEDVTSRIKKNPGETVIVGWRRPAVPFAAGGVTYSATIECATIQTPNVSSSLVAGNIGYLSIAQFNNKATDDVGAAITSLEQQGAQGYILDLRGDPGGYLMQAIGVTSLFLQDGTVVQVQSRTSGTSAKTVETEKHLTDKPVVVLVNQDSASASEIVASALKENGRGTIVGTTTFGKGSAQGIKSLSYGGAIKYTVAYYLTPNGAVIEGVGISPDVAVDMVADLRGTDGDVQYAVGLHSVQAAVAAAQLAAPAGSVSNSGSGNTSSSTTGS